MVGGGARAVERCDLLGVAPYSDMPDGLFRAYLTPAHRAAAQMLMQWMGDAGMAARMDAAGNIIGRYEGHDKNAPALLIGSHIDSVRDAGRYDGPLGIMLGIELVDHLRRSGTALPFAVEVIAFGDEEGSRFPAAMLTSRAVAGTLAPTALAIADGDGVSLTDALAAFTGTAISDFLSAARAPGDILAYLETHIEQGPVLESRGLAVGTVTGIAAQLRLSATVTGQANHAGTTTMALRHDAMAGAAEIMLAIERIARDDGSDLVATVGQVAALPGAPNVIAGQVRFTIDVRSGDAARRDRAAAAIRDAADAIVARRGLAFTMDQIHDLPASPCDPALMAAMDAAIAASGQPTARLVSGAGHDAMVMAALCPTAMLFIRCRDGISHHPAEHVDAADVQIALEVMIDFAQRLGEQCVAA